MSTTSRWPLGHGGSGGQGSGGHRRERFLPPSVRRSLIAFALILVVELLIAPQLAGAHKALHLLGSVQPAYIGVGILLEAGALLAYAQLTRTVLPKDGPSLSTLLRIDLSTMAVSHVLPGGTAAGAGLGYRLLTEKGVSGSDTGFALATQGIGSASGAQPGPVAGLVDLDPATGLQSPLWYGCPGRRAALRRLWDPCRPAHQGRGAG